jgi:hypothetical protein
VVVRVLVGVVEVGRAAAVGVCRVDLRLSFAARRAARAAARASADQIFCRGSVRFFPFGAALFGCVTVRTAFRLALRRAAVCWSWSAGGVTFFGGLFGGTPVSRAKALFFCSFVWAAVFSVACSDGDFLVLCAVVVALVFSAGVSGWPALAFRAAAPAARAPGDHFFSLGVGSG